MGLIYFSFNFNAVDQVEGTRYSLNIKLNTEIKNAKIKSGRTILYRLTPEALITVYSLYLDISPRLCKVERSSDMGMSLTDSWGVIRR